MSVYIKKTERSQINDLTIYLKLLLKQEQANLKTNRREIIKIRGEINQIETKKNTKIDRPLANLTKMRRKKTQLPNSVESGMQKGRQQQTP
jgi:hypothetical protein